MSKVSHFRIKVDDAPLVTRVLRAGDEPDVPRRIIAVHIDAIHLKTRVVPTGEGDCVLQESRAIDAPLVAYPNAATAVAAIAPIRRAVAAADRRSEPIKQPATVFIVRDDAGVLPVPLGVGAGCPLRARVAARACAATQVRDMDG